VERLFVSSKENVVNPAFACEENERILNTYAINPGGTFSFDADNKATFCAEQTAAALDVFPRASRLPGSAGA